MSTLRKFLGFSLFFVSFILALGLPARGAWMICDQDFVRSQNFGPICDDCDPRPCREWPPKIDRKLPGNYPLVNMSQFMFNQQDRNGNIRLEGVGLNFDPDNPNQLIRVDPGAVSKTFRIEDAEDGSPQFLLLKGWDGVPLEFYVLKDQRVFIRYEEMGWDNREYREHRHHDGTLSFEWTKDAAKPYEPQYRTNADYTWHYCDYPSQDYYAEFAEYVYFPSRVFDLTVEPIRQVEEELNEVDGVDTSWLGFGKAFGYPDAHVLLVVNDYYWGPLGDWGPEYNDVWKDIEKRWEFHERYKYMALQMPDGTLFPVGNIGFTWFTHIDPEKPMIKQQGFAINEVVFEEPGKIIHPYLACEPHN